LNIKYKEMKKLLLLIFVSFMTLSSFSQQKEERKLGDFNEIKVSNAINLYLKQGNDTKAVIEADGIDLDQVITEVSGGRLKVSVKSNNNFRRSVHIKVYLTYKSLEVISASSASDVYSESIIKTEDLKVIAGSAASVKLNIDVERLEMSVASAGDIEISGTADEIQGTARSAGDIDAFDLVAKTADVNAHSAGGIKINVTDDIKARASTGGSVKYKGNPLRSNTDSSSGGSVRKY
jgi:hypothetical protein